MKDAKPERKVDSWNCGGNHFARDCTKPANKSDDKKGKAMVRSETEMMSIMVMELYLCALQIVF